MGRAATRGDGLTTEQRAAARGILVRTDAVTECGGCGMLRHGPEADEPSAHKLGQVLITHHHGAVAPFGGQRRLLAAALDRLLAEFRTACACEMPRR
jgi:hypothetical protein